MDPDLERVLHEIAERKARRVEALELTGDTPDPADISEIIYLDHDGYWVRVINPDENYVPAHIAEIWKQQHDEECRSKVEANKSVEESTPDRNHHNPAAYERTLPPRLLAVHLTYKRDLQQWINVQPLPFPLPPYRAYVAEWESACNDLFGSRWHPQCPAPYWRIHKGVLCDKDFNFMPSRYAQHHLNQTSRGTHGYHSRTRHAIQAVQQFGVRLKENNHDDWSVADETPLLSDRQLIEQHHVNPRYIRRQQHGQRQNGRGEWDDQPMMEGLAEGQQIHKRSTKERWRIEGSIEPPSPRFPYGRAWANTIRQLEPQRFGDVMRRLTKKQKQIFREYFEENWLQWEIARRHRMYDSAVSEVLTRIKGYFRDAKLPEPKHLRSGRRSIRPITGRRIA